jgi:hypothetical protein
MRLVPIVLCCVRLALASDYTRDWTRFPPVIERNAPAALFAIGDIHGDYERLLRLLIAARLIPAIPAKPELAVWGAGTSTLVVTGDMIDKGPRPVDVLHYLIALRTDARKRGGEVILLAGNHEVEFLATPDQKKSEEFVADLKRAGISPSDVVACRGDIGELFCSLPYAARVGEWFFSHAGNTEGFTLDQLAAGIEKGVDRSGFASKELTGANSLLEARLTDGKEWFDAPDGRTGEQQILSRNAAALGVRHIVQGHQPKTVKFADGAERKPGEMFQRWGLLFLIDTGMSRGVGDSAGAALRFSDGRAVAICPDGTETVLWTAQSNPALGRARACQVP